MSVAWSEYLFEVMPETPDCPDAIAINAVRNAAIEFAEFTSAWREWLTVNVVASQPNYTLTPTTGKVVIGLQAYYKESSIPFLDLEQMRYQGDWPEDTGDQPKGVMMTTPGTLLVYPVMDENLPDPIEVLCSIKPARTDASGPDHFYEDWIEVIAHGAKYRLLSMEGRPWYNGNGAIDSRNKFRSGMREARIRYSRMNNKKETVIRPRRFGYYDKRWIR